MSGWSRYPSRGFGRSGLPYLFGEFFDGVVGSVDDGLHVEEPVYHRLVVAVLDVDAGLDQVLYEAVTLVLERVVVDSHAECDGGLSVGEE